MPVYQHDTTAHSLAFALILMAMYPDEQEKLYKSIHSAIPDGHLPVRRLTSLARTWPQHFPDIQRHTQAWSSAVMDLRDLASLSDSRPSRGFALIVCGRLKFDRLTRLIRKPQKIACFQLRMVGVSPCPKEPKSLRWSLRCTIVVCTMARLLVQSNSMTPAKHWVQPLTFKPDRFLGEYNQSAFLPFSMGARGCIGRRYERLCYQWPSGSVKQCFTRPQVLRG
jgi:hypothetical protein